MSRPVVARGRTITVTLHRGRVTLAPSLWERLRHGAVARHFRPWEAALEWSPPGLLRGGELLFDLSESGSWGDEVYLVKYRRSQARQFARLVDAGRGRWLEVLVG